MQTEELTPKLVGARVRRVEDPRFLTGRAQYTDDLTRPGLLHAAFVRSPYAHARIRGVDLAPALALKGVVGGLTGAEVLAIADLIRADSTAGEWQASAMPALATERVRYAGEPVAVVVATDRYLAEDAAEQVVVDYEPLPPVVDAEAALRPDAPILHPGWKDNAFVKRHIDKGDVDGAFAAADGVVRLRTVSHRQAGVPLENRVSLAEYNWARGELTLWTATQVPHILRTSLADVLRFPEHRLRVIAPDVGGGFGIKANLFPEDVVLCLLAMRLDQPVKWLEDRREHLLASAHAREAVHEVEAAYRADGTVLGVRARLLVDIGAYSVYPWTAGIEPGMALGILPGPYRIRDYRCDSYGVATNKCPLGTYRGVARPASCFTTERLMDEVARATGLDPAEVRRRNLVRPEEFPYTSVTELLYDSGSFVESLDKLLEAADYPALRQMQAEARQQGRYLGIGLATYTEQTAHATSEFVKRGGPIVLAYDTAAVRMDPSGKVTVMASMQSHGQGMETTFAQLAADQLGVPLADVTVLHGDTTISPYGMGTFASRSAVLCGGATQLAAGQVRDKLLRLAGHLLEARPEDLELASGECRVRGVPARSMSIHDLARIAYHHVEKLPPGESIGLEARHAYDAAPGGGTFTNSAQLALVELSPETGAVRLLRYVIVEDCGRMINPLVVEGQIHGGIAQGIGTALFEESIYDEQGQLLNTSFLDYLLPGAMDVPTMDIHHLETPSPFTIGGFKGMGEGGAIAPGAVIANAVSDALQPFGRIAANELPLTPERVLRLIEAARADSAHSR
jgi:carbon-monoxide dehydrogenase large subunit